MRVEDGILISRISNVKAMANTPSENASSRELTFVSAISCGCLWPVPVQRRFAWLLNPGNPDVPFGRGFRVGDPSVVARYTNALADDDAADGNQQRPGSCVGVDHRDAVGPADD